MSAILSTRQRCANGDSVARTARGEGASEPTVRKCRDMGDMSPGPPAGKGRGSMLDPYRPIVDAWPIEGGRRRRKRRRTATRVHERLRKEHGYKGGHSLVQAYVKQREAEPRAAVDMLLELEWAPGEAQAGFGECELRVPGVARTVRYLVVAFPLSNVSPAQVLWGGNPECAREGLKAVSGFAGGVPAGPASDDAGGVGRRTGEGVRTAATFRAFAAHHGFGLSLCSADAGHEEGAVGNAVGAMRGNPSVPMPPTDDVRSCNERLPGKCVGRAAKDRCLRSGPERQPFAEGCAAPPDLPAEPSRAFKPGTCETDGHGRACPGGRHRHPLGPGRACGRALVELGAFEIAFLDGRGTAIASLERAYGDAPTEATDPISQPALLCRRPGGWRGSQARAAVPDGPRAHMDALPGDGPKAAPLATRDAGAQAGWAATVDAMAALAASGSGPPAADLGGYDAAFACGRGERGGRQAHGARGDRARARGAGQGHVLQQGDGGVVQVVGVARPAGGRVRARRRRAARARGGREGRAAAPGEAPGGQVGGRLRPP